ncbi:cytochrome P450 [Yoonia sp. 2307UL14-13]
MGNGVKTLLEHGVKEITEPCIEEIIRYDPPLHMFTRWAYEDVTIGDHCFKRGDQIGCLLGAANRDPTAYPNPNSFDPTRTGPKNTSFGGGIHLCVGAPLARLELQIGLEMLWERCPELRMVGEARYGDVYHFHGLEGLVVKL